MRVIKFFLRFLFILLVLFFIAGTIYVRIYGKSLLEGALNTALKRNVVIGKASYHFPFGLKAQDIHIAQSLQGGEFLKIRQIVAHLSPDAIYQGKFTFDTVVLVEPSVVIKHQKKSPEILNEQAAAQIEVVSPVVKDIPAQKEETVIEKSEEKTMPLEVIVRRLIIKKGRLRYVDGLTEKGFSFDLEDVQIKAGKIVFPVREERSEFEFSAHLVKEGNPFSGSDVRGFGWMDIAKKDMNTKIEVVEKSGKVGLTARAVSKDNDMEVTGEISMQNLLQGVSQDVSSETSSINDLVLNALSSAGVEIGARFAFTTKMDDFRIGQVSFSGKVLTK